jgi:hypothetical protein
MYRWTHKRAAWFGFRLGRGAPLESVLRDRRIGAHSEQALRGVATRWGLAFGDDKSPLLAIPIPPADQEVLEQAATARRTEHGVIRGDAHSHHRPRAAVQRRAGRRIVIAPLPKPVRDYLSEFGLACIYVTPDGRTGVTRNLAHVGAVAAAWWAKDAATAHAVVRALGEHAPASLETATAEILAAAKRIDAVLSEHDVVLARAQAALSQLDGKLAAAQSKGELQFFNRAYREYRLACQQRGERAMVYGVALAKLRGLLASAAAGTPVSDLMAAVFER